MTTNKVKIQITKQQYYQLQGLKHLAEKYISQIREIETAALDITGEEDTCGHTMDIVWNNRSVDEGLKLLNIVVKK